MRGKRLTEEQISEVVRLFPNHTKRELRSLTGVGFSSIDRIQSEYHLRKSPEHIHNMGVRAGKASNIARGGDSSACYTPEAIAKRVDTYKKTRNIEEMRYRWGLPQRTRIRLRHKPKSATDQSSYLRGLGYIVDESSLVAYYTDRTRRATRLERLGRGGKTKQMRCYFDFLPFTSIK